MYRRTKKNRHQQVKNTEDDGLFKKFGIVEIIEEELKILYPPLLGHL